MLTKVECFSFFVTISQGWKKKVEEKKIRMQLHAKAKSEHQKTFDSSSSHQQNKVLHFPQSLLRKQKASHGNANITEAACVATFFWVEISYIRRKEKVLVKKKIKITQTHRELCVADDPSGNKLVLGGGATLGGRVRVRLVADDHFGRDAQPLFDNAAADEDKCKMKC